MSYRPFRDRRDAGRVLAGLLDEYRGRPDVPVIELNRKAMRRLRGEARLEVIAGASHLFSEPGALELVARLARDWFTRYLKPGCDERRA